MPETQTKSHKLLIVTQPEQCGYYDGTCGDCFHPKAKKWAGCGGEISKDCPLPDVPHKLPKGCPAKSQTDCEYFVDGVCIVEGDNFWIENGGCKRAIEIKRN